jgi:hypothetical protein
LVLAVEEEGEKGDHHDLCLSVGSAEVGWVGGGGDDDDDDDDDDDEGAVMSRSEEPGCASSSS